MQFEEVKSISDAAVSKLELLEKEPKKYFLRGIMAGVFVVMAMILNNVAGNMFFESNPSLGKLIGAIYFSVAVLLIVMIGGELFTGNNFVMAIGYYQKSLSLKSLLKVWGCSYLANFVGSIGFAWIFILSGASSTGVYFETCIKNKVFIPYPELFFKAILCNFFVCVGILCGIKLKTEIGKILMIIFCISGFTISGFEHSIANMSTYTVGWYFVRDLPLLRMLINLLIVSLGNAIGGAVLLAWPIYHMASKKEENITK